MSPHSDRWSSLLPRFSIGRPITVLLLLVTVLVVGGVAANRIPLELLPSGFTNPYLSVQVPWRDAPSQEVLEKITKPLEEELSTVKGIDKMTSVAVTGFTRVGLQFKQETDMDVAYREVRDRVERAKARLPDDVEQVFIRKHDAGTIPVFVIGLAVDPAVADAYNLIQNKVVLPLSRIDGVAAVEAQGLEEKEILIELDRERTESAGLNIYQLAQDLGSDNFSLASGTVYDGEKKLLLRSVARFETLDQVRDRLVSQSVRVRDIAKVSYALPDTNYRVRVMGRPAVALIILKEGQANTLEVAARVAAAVELFKESPHLQSIEMMPLFDQGDVILESLSTLLDSGRVGGLFAIVVLFFFLRRVRMTFIIALAIPLSILVALTVMYFVGETLNIMTLLALMISIGLLVDNSVVAAENIFRFHREGYSRRDACVKGASEIALAIVMATLTTVIVFVPVSLVDGQGQYFLQRLAIPISVALVGSLLVALIFIPLSVYLTLPRRGGNGSERSAFRRGHDRFNAVLHRAYDNSFGLINRGYGRLLGLFLRRRLDLVLLLAALFGVTGFVAMKEVKFVEIQEEERGGFELDVELPQNTTLEEAEEYFLAAEAVVEGLSDELDLAGSFIFHRATHGEIQGWFNNPRLKNVSPREVTERVLAALPEKAGARIYSGSEEENQDDRAKQSEVAFTLYGEDAAILESVAVSLEDLLVRMDGVLGIKRVGDEAPSELALVVNREKAQLQQVNPEVVAAVVGYALRGQTLPRFQRDGIEIPVRVRFQEEDRESLAQLIDFEVPTETDSFVPLSTVTEVVYLSTAQRIFRENKRTSRSITVELVEGEEETAREQLMAMVSRVDFPEGISLGSDAQSSNEDMQGMAFAAVLSVIFIYLLMGFLFESFVLPLSVILTIPMAGLGVVWIHYGVGLDIDFLGVVAMIVLIGVVVNNGIVLVDYVTRLRNQGHDRDDALLQAADRRFRPIMMTALTTIGSLVPLTLAGANSIGLSYKSFGLTLIGGLTTATIMTLLVVPVFYTFFDDLRTASIRLIKSGRRAPAAEATEVAT